jgi:beta-galactosidase
MNHRRLSMIVIVVLCLSGIVRGAPGREETSLEEGWKFIKQQVEGASDRQFDDASWSSVNLPHTWNADDATGGKNEYYRGPGWYRRHLNLTREQADKKLYLYFGAAGMQAEVFVNGQPAGTHVGGFAAFCFDITPLVSAGDNVLAVRVDNSRNADLAPLAGDFNLFGGLYRGVKLIATETLAITPLDYASSGVYIKQNKITDTSAELEVIALIRNAEPADYNVSVKCTITDADGKAVATGTSSEPFSAGQSGVVSQSIKIDNPHLWNGKSDPYLYSALIEVGNGQETTDRMTIPIGLRYFKVDPKQGFILNGKPYDLHGVNRHQDFGDKGWAITEKEMQIDMGLIKELGATMVRLAHYQHSPLFYDLCDKNGLVVWAELCQVNQLGRSENFAELSKQQLVELIKQNYNHPSICFWSLYNELNFSGGEQDLKLLNEENDLAHELDPTRLTTAASNKRVQLPGHWIPDVIGFNVYYGWYADQVPPDWKSGLEGIVSFKPDRAVGISEYGAGGSINQHEIPPKRPATTARFHPEEYQMQVHEEGWKAMKDQPLWCRLIWVFADFPVASRREGDTVGMNDKGLVTKDRKTKKDIFYFYKAQWSDEPVLWITSRRYTPRPMPVTQFKVYSNLESVELKVNGKSIGSKSSADRVFVWDNVPLSAGANQVEATGTRDGKTITDTCTIVQSAADLTNPQF